MSTPVWSARTGTNHISGISGGAFSAYGESTTEDAGFVSVDAQGSIAHVMGLHHAGLLDASDAAALIQGLQELAQGHANGAWSLDPALEDVHMNLEAALTEALGETGKRLHTGRSRNDQVATCLVLHARAGLATLAGLAHQVSSALLDLAAAHIETPWVARTHAQPAQPATLGFLLHAHATRFSDLAATALQSFEAINESPLGCGAVAGSTLPLDPAFTAGLMGLKPPRNAILATGSRPTVVAATNTAAAVGLATASLAQDLMDLFGQKFLLLAPGHTTGSSLMPQKRNPDALELLRGTGKALTQAPAQAMGLIAGLGLGYQRDLQATKPLQAQALTSATETLTVLLEVVNGAHFDVDRLTTSLDAPGITATDMAEALVAHGKPFRDAYNALAQTFLSVEHGVPLANALAQSGLAPAEVQIALEAATPDPARRTTLAGPAPVRVQEAIAGLQNVLAVQAAPLAVALDAVTIPESLLLAPPNTLLGPVVA